jgi:hypothetical protein
MLPRHLQSVDPVARLQRRIAVSFQQVVEKLHIELIIFNDQNCLHKAAFIPKIESRPAERAWRHSTDFRDTLLQILNKPDFQKITIITTFLAIPRASAELCDDQQCGRGRD